MSARHVAHVAGWGLGCVLAPIVLRGVFGRGWGALGVLLALAVTGWLVILLPRMAHGAFEAARYRRAGRRYRLLGALAFSARRERAALLSRAGCEVARGRSAAADALLATVDPAALDATERVTWLNNRACVLLEPGLVAGPDGDPPAALALVEEAVGLRPDVPAIQHTRGRALLATGRVDEAITVFEAMRAGGELPPHLEAERCRDLAVAWERKGQAAYAADYRDRARLHAP